MFGHQPYNPNIQGRENDFVSYAAFGEGYHNYHHSFPSDYATSELNTKINLTKHFIDAMAWIGLAYDRKRVSPRLLQMRKANAAVVNKARELKAY
jgi:stearoyl-CoA desaturase (delta-9 desaturase)